MKRGICDREPAVLRAVRLGLVDEELRAHLPGCDACAELLELAGLLETERRAAMREAVVPSAGALWFQIRLRAARESGLRSARLLAAIQGASLFAALAIALAVFGVPSVPSPAAMLALVQPFGFEWAVPILTGSALFALLAPFAVWLAVRRSGS